MITFSQERLSDCLDEIKTIASLHYAEAGGYSLSYSEYIDYDAYVQMDRLGVLLSVIARADGALVGYWGGIQHCDMHSALNGKRIFALSQVVWYMLPSYRRVAKQFVRALERIAAEKGISWLTLGATNERTDAFLAKIGYSKGEMVRVKVLDADVGTANRQAPGAAAKTT